MTHSYLETMLHHEPRSPPTFYVLTEAGRNEPCKEGSEGQKRTKRKLCWFGFSREAERIGYLEMQMRRFTLGIGSRS